jgi:hypothetical protein
MEAVAVSGGFILKGWSVKVRDFPESTYYASTRGKALSSAWSDFTSAYECTFGQFLKIVRCVRRTGADHPRLGEPITVGGKPAFWVGCNRQYIQFVYDGDDIILSSHPYDVEPPEARRGTPYYEASAA